MGFHRDIVRLMYQSIKSALQKNKLCFVLHSLLHGPPWTPRQQYNILKYLESLIHLLSLLKSTTQFNQDHRPSSQGLQLHSIFRVPLACKVTNSEASKFKTQTFLGVAVRIFFFITEKCTRQVVSLMGVLYVKYLCITPIQHRY